MNILTLFLVGSETSSPPDSWPVVSYFSSKYSVIAPDSLIDSDPSVIDGALPRLFLEHLSLIPRDCFVGLRCGVEGEMEERRWISGSDKFINHDHLLIKRGASSGDGAMNVVIHHFHLYSSP